MYHIDRDTNININTITNANIKKNTITHMQSLTIFPILIFVFYDLYKLIFTNTSCII